QEYSRGKAKGKLKEVGPVHNRRGTTVTFHPDAQIFGAESHFRAATLYRMARSKAYLFKGVEIRWKCDGKVPRPEGVPEEEVLHFPGGLADYLAAALEEKPAVTRRPFTGAVEFDDGGRVEWAIAWPVDEDDGFVHS